MSNIQAVGGWIIICSFLLILAISPSLFPKALKYDSNREIMQLSPRFTRYVSLLALLLFLGGLAALIWG
ncbi:MAG: hypothetical protein M3N59_00770 [bacterium]|nr:hypothetical protein [bacterium]